MTNSLAPENMTDLLIYLAQTPGSSCCDYNISKFNTSEIFKRNNYTPINSDNNYNCNPAIAAAVACSIGTAIAIST